MSDKAGSTGLSRRELMRRGALAGGAAIWVTPAVQSVASPVFGAAVSPAPGPEGCGRMTGGGFIDTERYGRVTYGFQLRCGDPAVPPNRLEVNWSAGRTPHQFHLTGPFSAVCTDTPGISPNPPKADFDTLTGTGTGRLRIGSNKQAATVEVTLTDAGEPGSPPSGVDRTRILVRDSGGAVVLLVDGFADGGNLQAHRATGSKAC